MKKTVIVVFAFIMLLSAASFGTSTRTWVMGDNDRIMVDDGNIFRYPGRTFNYPNLALGEFSDGDFDNFGVTWKFGEDNPWVLGTFVATWPYYGPVGYDGTYLAMFPYYEYYTSARKGAAQSDEELNNYGYPTRLQMLYSRQLGSNNFGFGLDIVRAKWEVNIDSTEYYPLNYEAKQSFNQFRFTFGLTEGTSGQWDVAASFMTGSWTNEDTSATALSEPNGFYELGVNGRYFYVYNPKITFVPHAEFAMGKRGTDSHLDPNYGFRYVEDTMWTFKTSYTMFDMGFGMNYTTGPKMLAVFDFGFTYEKTKMEFSGNGFTEQETGELSATSFALPYLKIGFEGEVFSWMDVRAGGKTQLWFNKDKYESDIVDIGVGDETWDTPYNDTYLGCGFHFGRLHLDTYMDPAILTNGLYFINGTETDELNWSVSLLYELF